MRLQLAADAPTDVFAKPSERSARASYKMAQ
jgi:hypothetical protein